MRHGRKTRKLGRTRAHRLALIRNLASALFAHERIQTTLPKAKEARRHAERLITLAKTGTLAARRQVVRSIADKGLVTKLFDTIAPRFADREGGYTRILRMGAREGDGAELALLELVVREETRKEQRVKAARKGRGKPKKAAEEKSRKKDSKSAKS